MFFSTLTLLSVLSTSTVGLSIPVSTNSIGSRAYGCSVADAQLSIPANQTSIVVPSGTPIYVALGFGTQVGFLEFFALKSSFHAFSRTILAAQLALSLPSELSLSSLTSLVLRTVISSQRFRKRYITLGLRLKARRSSPTFVSALILTKSTLAHDSP